MFGVNFLNDLSVSFERYFSMPSGWFTMNTFLLSCVTRFSALLLTGGSRFKKTQSMRLSGARNNLVYVIVFCFVIASVFFDT